MSSLLARTIQFLGLRRSIGGLLGMTLLIGMGEKMAERFLPIYILALGGGSNVVGVLNGLNNLLSALYSYPGGYLADRLGTKRALFVFNLLAMAGFLIVIVLPYWQAVLVGAVFFMSWTAISLPATMSLVARVLPSTKRTMGVTLHSLIRRFPAALGPVIGGYCISLYGERLGIRVAFGAAFMLAAVALVMQQKMIEEDPSPDGPAPIMQPRLGFLMLMTPDLRRLLISDMLIRFCEQIPYAFVVIWCMKTIPHPVTALQFGLLTSIEMAVAVLIYIPVAWWADRTAKKPFVVITFIFFTLFPIMLLFSESFWPLVAAFAVRGLKEFGEPTRKALIMDLSLEGRKAETFGAYYLLRDLVVSIAAFTAGPLWSISPRANFLTASAFGLAGTIWFALRGKDLSRS